MSIQDFCKKHNLTEGQCNGTEKIGGDLYLRGLTSIPEGFNPTVGGGLDLSGLTSIPEGFNPTVGGYLDLSGLTSIPEGFNPTVGGSLDLSGLTSIPEGFNPTVGGELYLAGLTSIPEGFNPTVGGYLYLSGRYSDKKTAPKSDIVFFQGGAYLKADGIFAKVIQAKKGVYRLCKLNSAKEFFMVTDGKFTHAHGETLKEAKESFKFKIESERIKSEPITLETVVKIQHYRIITGACEFGVKNWIEANIPENIRESVVKNGIKAKDLIPLLEKTDAYGLSRFKALIQPIQS